MTLGWTEGVFGKNVLNFNPVTNCFEKPSDHKKLSCGISAGPLCAGDNTQVSDPCVGGPSYGYSSFAKAWSARRV